MILLHLHEWLAYPLCRANQSCVRAEALLLSGIVNGRFTRVNNRRPTRPLVINDILATLLQRFRLLLDTGRDLLRFAADLGYGVADDTSCLLAQIPTFPPNLPPCLFA